MVVGLVLVSLFGGFEKLSLWKMKENFCRDEEVDCRVGFFRGVLRFKLGNFLVFSRVGTCLVCDGLTFI